MVGLQKKREGREGVQCVCVYLSSWWWLISTIKPKEVWPEARNKIAIEESTSAQNGLQNGD